MWSDFHQSHSNVEALCKKHKNSNNVFLKLYEGLFSYRSYFNVWADRLFSSYLQSGVSAKQMTESD